jgi:uncharacterized protein (DUF924 family)
MPDALPSAADVVRFWTEAGRLRWFRKDEAFDAEFRSRFLAAHEVAARGESMAWLGTSDGALALLILLDQFPRNAFRGTARVYATDALARNVAHEAVLRGHDARAATDDLRNFFYLPFMHSEWLPDQDRALQLCQRLGNDAGQHATGHRDVIARFGRFPHRNALLGRKTTPEEQAFLDAGGFQG